RIGADDMDRILGRKTAQHRIEFALRRHLFGTVKANRRLTDMLDDVEDRLPLLLADGIAQNAAEEVRVAKESNIALGRFGGCGSPHDPPAEVLARLSLKSCRALALSRTPAP